MTIGRERIAVTGVGLVTALGMDAASTYGALISGASGIRPLEGVLHGCLTTPIAAQISEELAHLSRANAPRSERFAEIAAREAIDSAGLKGSASALVLGASTGATREGIAECMATADPSIEPLVHRLVNQPIGSIGDRLAPVLGNKVASTTVVCSACSSGALAVAIGAMRLEQGDRLPQIVGGTDSLNLLTLSGFGSLSAMSPEPCRPFDVARRGLNLGEGAGFLVLETESMVARRGAKVLAWLDGYAIGAEAHHLTHPEPTGERASELIREALNRAGLTPADVDYVNAHGTATLANDSMECAALRSSLGATLAVTPTTSSKGQIGHTLAAAGAIEAAILVQALVTQTIPPTVGLVEPAPDCLIAHLPQRGARREIRAAITNSFGFGGACAVLAMQRSDRNLGRLPDDHPPITVEQVGSAEDDTLCVTGLVTCGEAGILSGPMTSTWLERGCGAHRVALPFDPLELLVMERSRRFDRLSALATLACDGVLKDAAWPTRQSRGTTEQPTLGHVGLVLGNALGPVDRTAGFVERVLRRGPKGVNPAEFPQLLPSSAPSNASIYAELRGPVFCVSALGATTQAALELGSDCLRAQLAAAMVVGTVEVREDGIVRAQSDPHWDCNDGAAVLLLERQATAVRRGASGCELSALGWLADSPIPAPAPAPLDGQSLVLWASERSHEVVSVTSRLGWSRVPVRPCLPAVHSGWAFPTFVLAAGIGMVQSGGCDSVLVITDSPRGLHFAVARRSRTLQCPNTRV